MAFNNLYIQSGGSNSNSGSTSSNTPVWSNTSSVVWVGTTTGTLTVTDSAASAVQVGDWINVGGTCIMQVASINAVSAPTYVITVTTTAGSFYGTEPTGQTYSTNGKVIDGGAWADFGAPAGLTGTIPVSTKINIKAGTYTNTSTSRTLALSGTGLLRLSYSGYNVTPGDLDASPTVTRTPGTNMPTVTFTTGHIVLSGTHTTWSGIDITGATISSGGQVQMSGSFNEMFRCRITCTGANANSLAVTVSADSIVSECYLQASSSASVVTPSTSSAVIGNTISGGLLGISSGAGPVDIINNIFLSQASHCIQSLSAAANYTIIGNSAYGTQVGDFYNIATASPNTICVVANNEVYGMVNGINNATGTNIDTIRRYSNSYGNLSGSAEVGLGDTPAFDGKTESGMPFTSSTDLTLLATAAGYKSGMPGLFENSATKTYANIGAQQANPSVPLPGGIIVRGQQSY